MIKNSALGTLLSALALERDRLALWMPVLLATGIGIYFALPYEPAYWMAPAAIVLAASLAIRGRRLLALRLPALAALIAAIGFAAADIRTASVGAPVLHKTLYFRNVEGRIDDISLKPKGETLTLSELAIEGVREKTTPARITVSLRKEAPELNVGDRIRIRAMLFPPPTPTAPQAYDFARAFYYDRIGAVGFSPFSPEVLDPAKLDSFALWLNDLRLNLAQRIRAPMAADNGPVAAAIMVGDQAGISDEVKESMRDSGLYHVLSISGLHMSLAVGLVYVAVRFLLSLYMPLALRLPVKKIAAAVGLLSALAYLLLAGYPVPAVRSFVMVACIMIAVLFDRRGISLYSLAWAASLILLFQPEALLSASFQLSFAATLAIITLYERFSPLLYASGRGFIRMVGVYFTGLVATSLVATFATTPLVITHFNRFTVWGVAANMLMMPLASFWIMPAAVLSFLAMPFGLEAWPIAALDHGIGFMVATSRWFASLPYASVPVPSPAPWGFFMVVAGGLWFCLWQRRWRFFGIPAILIGLSTIALHRPYDVWINEDATKVMTRLESGEYLLLRGTAKSFDAESWLKAEGEETALTLKDMKGKPGEPECDKLRCAMTLHGKRLLVAKRKDETKSLCREPADIVISSDWLDGVPDCDTVPLLIDERFLKLRGAAGLRLGGEEVRMETSSDYRGKRPWVVVPKYALYPKGRAAMMPKLATEEEKNDR